jgi:hypothetical protein
MREKEVLLDDGYVVKGVQFVLRLSEDGVVKGLVHSVQFHSFTGITSLVHGQINV